MCAFWSLGTWDSHVGRKGGEGGFSGFPGVIYMEFPCKELTKNGITWNSHVLADLRASLHGIPMWGAEKRPFDPENEEEIRFA